MLNSRYSFVPRPEFVNAIAVVAAIAFLGAGFALFGVCDGGVSLILCGAAAAVLGGLPLFHPDSLALVFLISIIALTLVIGGLYGMSVAGCLP